MRFLVRAPAAYYQQVGADLIRLFFPQAKISLVLSPVLTDPKSSAIDLAEAKAILTFRELVEEKVLAVHFQLGEKEVALRASVPDGPKEEQTNLHRRLIRQMTQRVFEEATGQSAGPWGILTGPRPMKLVHRRLDQGWEAEAVFQELTREYKLDPAKAALLLEIGQRQQPFFLSPMAARQWVSIYVGIPFCPTRCLYCSFPAYAVSKAGTLVEAFLVALEQEIRAVGKALEQQGLRVQNVYVGGGTPTVLTPDRLERLLALLREELPFNPGSGSNGEFNVEAGRPDTLDVKRLQVLKAAGVNRLSINPQTMQDATLSLIGRRHTASDIEARYFAARELGFAVLNMDVILGLPGETAREVAHTLSRLALLKPENLSVHILAIKRASRLKEESPAWSLPDAAEVVQMLEISQAVTTSLGMHPYYLYRQKNILAPLENVGYALPGTECLYNIQVMEERQSIIGLGGGAGSKWVNTADWTLVNTYNPKDPRNYTERINEIIAKKIKNIGRVSERD